MARSPKSITNATSTPSTDAQASRQSTIIPPAFSQPGLSNQSGAPTTRTRSRRPSVASLSGSSLKASSSITPSTSGPSTPTVTTTTPTSNAGVPKLSKTATAVDRKSHALRSVLGEKERTPCPFPSQYGGKEKCGVVDEDLQDEVLMSVCAACATINNRALSADEIASIAIDQAWLRPPSAAVGPSTIINNAIRAHQKRCASAVPPRQPLVKKYQLAGSLNETVLEPALHPRAFEGPVRPKGTVWYLVPSGRAKWKNPFDGLEVPTPPPRKPLAAKKAQREAKAEKESSKSTKTKKANTEEKASSTKGHKIKMPAGSTPTPPLKLRLVVNRSHATDDDLASEAGSSSQGSRNMSRQSSVGDATSVTSALPPAVALSIRPVTIKCGTKSARRIRTYTGDSSDDSESSDSGMEMDLDSQLEPSSLGLSRLSGKPVSSSSSIRKERPPPLPLGHHVHSHSSSRHASSNGNMLSRSIGSPLVDWAAGAISSPTFSATNFPPPLSSPFPTHSLDNTTWAVRHDPDQFASFETSSSSSDDEMREPVEWGTSSGILIQGSSEDMDGAKALPVWSAEDEEAKVKEATDALRVLFPMSSPDEDVVPEPAIQFNQLDNRPRPAPSDTSSLAESTSTATATARGPLKSADLAASIALAAWAPSSSPIPSPHLKSLSVIPNGDTSPSQHLSKLHNSFEPTDMDIDEEPWLDETGELPVKAEDSFSDIDLGSTIGDTPTPEHDRQLNTAAWARDAAASVAFRVKEEPEDDYPSPITTETDGDDASAIYRASRASSSDSHTPSSRSSDLPAFELDGEQLSRFNMEEVLMGPESISLEELDGWIVPAMGSRAEKTPQRNGRSKSKHHRARTEGTRCSGDWGSIGVGVGLAATALLNSTRSTPLHRSRSTKLASRRRRSSPVPSETVEKDPVATWPTPPQDEDMTASAQDLDAMENVEKAIDVEDTDMDCVGPAELEAARAEADAKEEETRKAARARVEQHRALLEAYSHSVKEEQLSGHVSPELDGQKPGSPWLDMTGMTNTGAWGSSSTESINLTTPTPSAIPPSFLHSLMTPPGDMTMPMAMDPRALISPPLGATTPMLDEALSQAEIESMMKNGPGSGASGAKAQTSNKKEKEKGGSKKIVELPSTLPPDVANGNGSTPAPTKKAPAKAKGEKKETKAQREAKAQAAAQAQAQAQAQTAAAPNTGSSATQGQTNGGTGSATAPTAVPIAPKASTSTEPQKIAAPAAAAPTSSNATPNPPPSRPRSITKPLCPGLDACVVDNIPVYSHSYVNKKTGKSIVLLRRLDTDFVNASGLLLAMGIPVNKHNEYINASSPWHHAHHFVSAQTTSGVHSPGVAGMWIPFSEAKALEKKLKLDPSNPLANILRDDLFALFAKLAALNQEHSPADSFGLPFGAPMRVQSSLAKSSSVNNSKSTPNLSALSSSAPATHLRSAGTTLSSTTATPLQTPKGSLVRSAPATPPDGCPHPKRRRATIVGEASPMAKSALTSTAPTSSAQAIKGQGGNGAAGTKVPQAVSNLNAKAAATNSVTAAHGTAAAGGNLKAPNSIKSPPAIAPAPARAASNAVASASASAKVAAAAANIGGGAAAKVNVTAATPTKKPPPRAARPSNLAVEAKAGVAK